MTAVAFWLVFAVIARRWLARFRRGPLETVLRAIELVADLTVATGRIRRPALDRSRRVHAAGDAPSLNTRFTIAAYTTSFCVDDLDAQTGDASRRRADRDERDVDREPTTNARFARSHGRGVRVANLEDDHARDEDEQQHERGLHEREV